MTTPATLAQQGMDAATVDYLLDLPWFAVVDPAEPTPIYDAVVAAKPCWCGSSDAEPCRTKSGRALGVPHVGRGR